MKEIVFISGKGGTGKTSLMASVIPYLPESIIADCDVDAPDLHILLEPTELSREEYLGMKKALIDPDICIDCGHCRSYCTFKAVTDAVDSDGAPTGVPMVRYCLCEGCGVCAHVCPVGAITMVDSVAGSLSWSATSYGPLVHARLKPGEDSSGKLVFAVREKSREQAKKFNAGYILVDGSPGIGCSVISSLTNSDQAVVVTEPSMSGYHDLLRILDLTERLSIPVTVVINKCDISSELTGKIESHCRENNLPVGMKIPFNEDMIDAITRRKIPSEVLRDFLFANGFEAFIESLI